MNKNYEIPPYKSKNYKISPYFSPKFKKYYESKLYGQFLTLTFSKMFSERIYWRIDKNHIYQQFDLSFALAPEYYSRYFFDEKFGSIAIGHTIFDVAKTMNWPEERAFEIYTQNERVMKTGIQELNLEDGIYKIKKGQACIKFPELNGKDEIIGLIGSGGATDKISGESRIFVL